MTKFSITTKRTEAGKWAFGIKGKWVIQSEVGSISCPLSGDYEDEKSAKIAASRVIAKERQRLSLSHLRSQRQFEK